MARSSIVSALQFVVSFITSCEITLFPLHYRSISKWTFCYLVCVRLCVSIFSESYQTVSLSQYFLLDSRHQYLPRSSCRIITPIFRISFTLISILWDAPRFTLKLKYLRPAIRTQISCLLNLLMSWYEVVSTLHICHGYYYNFSSECFLLGCIICNI